MDRDNAAGREALRLEPGFSDLLKAVGGIGLLVSSLLFFRAYRDNPFLSALVRIQIERKHAVVNDWSLRFY